ncbi:MAG: phosphatidylserine decarboxylase [Deltaproteobacteria bacterium]|nr:phosphatidylserine decarboxylase [Deltaproteobacteria bacterium]
MTKIILSVFSLLLLAGYLFTSNNNALANEISTGSKNSSVNVEMTKHTDIVLKLLDIVNSNEVLRTKIENVLKEQKPESFWYKKSIEDMYNFFDEWLRFLPIIEDVRVYIDRFSEFDRSSGDIVRQSPFKEWIGDFVKARGQYMDSGESIHVIDEWLNHPEVNIGDYIVPPNGFKSFNEFFTRKIKPGKRPINSPNDNSILISPADCGIKQMNIDLTKDLKIKVKGMSLNVEQMLGGNPLAKSFVKGDALICSLMPIDYHRFHSPVHGKIVAMDLLAGLYFGIKDFNDFFQEQHRGYFIIETSQYGLVGIVPIGITTISSVNFLRDIGDDVQKGDELGYFAYGGSAIVLLFEPNRMIFFPQEADVEELRKNAVRQHYIIDNYWQKIIEDNTSFIEAENSMDFTKEDDRSRRPTSKKFPVLMGQQIGTLNATKGN